MKIKNYDELTALEIDTLREVGSIGTGNAATSLSQMLGCEVRITLPEVRVTMRPLIGLVGLRPSPPGFWLVSAAK